MRKPWLMNSTSATVQDSGDGLLRLYIAGDSLASQRARANLQTLHKKACCAEQFHIEIVDTLEEPQRALEDAVFLSPTLVKVSPPPAARLLGDLSDIEGALLALGITDNPRDILPEPSSATEP